MPIIKSAGVLYFVSELKTAAWLGFLDEQDKVRPGGIGCIGYCMSGRYVTTVAARFPNRFAARCGSAKAALT